jgi:uncharacterized protein (DUF433 family)
MAPGFNTLEAAYLASACLDAAADPSRPPREVYRDVAVRHPDGRAMPVTARAVAKAVEEGVLPPRSSKTDDLDAAAVLYLATIARWTAVQLKREAKARLVGFWRDSLAQGSERGGEGAVVQLDRDLLFDPHPAAERWRRLIETYAADRDRYVEIDPEKMGGVPVVRGTRVPVRSLLARHDGGDRLADIAQDWPQLPEAGLAAALAYARTHPPQGRPRKRFR